MKYSFYPLIFIASACLQAQTLTVPGTFSTLQQAIDTAPDGSVIEVSPGTYFESLEALDLNKDLYFRGTGGAASTIISGAGSSGLLLIANSVNGSADKNLIFDGFTFRDGFEGGQNLSPVTLSDTKPAFLNCIFENNRSVAKGGALLIFGSRAHPTFLNCTFRNNVSEKFGGAALVNGGPAMVTFKECLFDSNTSRVNRTEARNNGGGALYFDLADGDIFDCTFINNSCNYAGGAITAINAFNQPEGLLRIHNSRFTSNFADPLPGLVPDGNTEAGAIFAEGNFRIEIDRSFFEDNYAEGGGAVQGFRSHFTIKNSVFLNNRAIGGLGTGGAVSMSSDDVGGPDRREGELIMENVLIQGSEGHDGGGLYHAGDGTYNKQAPITLTDVVIEDCSSTISSPFNGNGGGMYLQNSNLTADGLYLLNNTAQRGGGGITLVLNTTINAVNSFIVGNDANGNDGVYDPQNNSPQWNNTYFGYNPPSSSGSALEHLAPVLDTTLFGTAYITYILSDGTGSPELEPGNFPLEDKGSYFAGVRAVSNLVEDTSFTLSSAAVSAQVDYAALSPDVFFPATIPSVPGFVEAEDYDTRGFGISYLDSNTSNAGTSYVTGDQVQILADGSASNNQLVGFIDAGEWLEYTVNVTQAAFYRISPRVASPSNTGSLYLQVNGSTEGAVIPVPNTGGWTAWSTLQGPDMVLEPGWNTIRVICSGNGYNMDGLVVTLLATNPVISATPDPITVSVPVDTPSASRTLNIRNVGVGTLTYSVTSSVGWIAVTPNSGTSEGENDALSIIVDTSGLAVGQYSESLEITSDDPDSPHSVTVLVEIREGGLNPLDYDGDGRADLAVYDPSTNNFRILDSSTDTVRQFNWGLLPSDLPVAGDFDGDGIADPAVLQDNGTWHLARSSAGYAGLQLGSPGVYAVPADFDADGATDMAIYEPWTGVWHQSKTTEGYFGIGWGAAGDLPVPGDYDGDGIADIGVYRPSNQTWYLICSTEGVKVLVWGLLPSDQPVPGDYDGDGTDDLAVYQANGTWHLARSSAGYAGLQLGAPGDVPVPADYDGDGAIDMAIFQPNGVWHISATSEGYRGVVFGNPGDLPVKSVPSTP